MAAEYIALLSSIGWATEAILVRKGGQHAPVSMAVLMSFSLTIIVLWLVNWSYDSLHLIYSPASIYFILGGFIQPGVVRILHYTGIVRLGASRAGPLRSVAPLFAMVIAFFVLSERPGLSVYTGALLSVMGLWLISYRRAGEMQWKTFDLIFPLGAAFLTALSQNIRKSGLLILPDPYIAAAMTTSAALVAFLVSLALTRQLGSLRMDRKALPFYGTAAVVSTLAQLFAFIALNKGQVSVVVPLVNTNPLFIVLLSAVFLKGLETINGRVIIGAVLMVSGIALITYR